MEKTYGKRDIQKSEIQKRDYKNKRIDKYKKKGQMYEEEDIQKKKILLYGKKTNNRQTYREKI